MSRYKILNDFPGYRIYEDGRIVSDLKGSEIATQKTNSGYSIAHLWQNNKRKAITVHRLVAMAFLPNVDNKPVINHKDGNKQNNAVSNLEWASQSENMKHAFSSGLSENARQSAKQRMSVIGKRYAKDNVKHILKANVEARKPVLQYDLNGNFIAEYESIKAARKATGCDVSRVINGVFKQSKGYTWRLK